MSKNKPRVSIGMPVYNGDKFLKEALDSILVQTFRDFELIISDNASTDQTEQICQIYADRDKRIRYYRNEKNLGAAWNFNRVFKLSVGEYFKWAAHDDICAPEFLSRCVEALDQDPSVVLSYPMVMMINEYGKFIKPLIYNMHGDSLKPHERFLYNIWINHWCIHVFGVMRASVLKKTPLIANYVGSDRVLLAHLSLLGRFYEVPQYLFFNREHPLRSVRKIHSLYDRIEWFDPKKSGKYVFPYWRFFIEYFFSIFRAPLNWHDRILCSLQIVRWLKRYWRAMIDDLLFFAKKVLPFRSY